MKTIETISGMSTFSKTAKKEGKSIGLVPTMGALHEGHLSLVRAAKKENDIVVMSVFVNPIQFGPSEDLDKYPRDFKRDGEMARAAGVDAVFHPSASQMYPEGFSTYVNVEGLTDTLCGASRPGHFRGVTTVVMKLFAIVKPDAAYFGQKDAQQAIVVKKMAEDLNLDIDVRILPVVREKDGLAMSSRNAYLSTDERKDSAVLYQALRKAEDLMRQGETDPAKVVKAMEGMIKAKQNARIDYIAVVDPKNLRDAKTVSGDALVALAVFIGKTRLIDNVIVTIGS
ncbi:MAG: pantoate--beta-alanine ligase [Candidatus Omnitrophica bacterium]|nr:pantoate--beta-alanine ligase [Candidatus Omnitrophota bacterium]